MDRRAWFQFSSNSLLYWVPNQYAQRAVARSTQLTAKTSPHIQVVSSHVPAVIFHSILLMLRHSPATQLDTAQRHCREYPIRSLARHWAEILSLLQRHSQQRIP